MNAQYEKNVGINTVTPTAALSVKGNGNTVATQALKLENSDGINLLTINNNGTVSGSAMANLAGGGVSNGFLFTNLNSSATISTASQVVNISGNYTLTLPTTPSNGQLVYIISPNNNGAVNANGKQIILQDGSQLPGFDYTTFPNYRISLLIYNGTSWYNPF